MKFLPKNMEGKNLIPLNFSYHKGDWKKTGDDAIEILYKDLDTGQKFLETIIDPKIEVWIVKPEHRTYNHFRDFIPKEHCDCYRVHYKTRFNEIGKILGLSPKQAKTSHFVSQSDIDVCHFYFMEFVREYPTNAPKAIDIGFLDIETDIININHFPEPGEVPINLISILDAQTKQMYTLINVTNNVKSVPKEHNLYDFYEGLRIKFNNNIDEFKKCLNDGSFKKELEQTFESSYPGIEYNLLVFEDEISLLKVSASILNSINIDFLLIWKCPVRCWIYSC